MITHLRLVAGEDIERFTDLNVKGMEYVSKAKIAKIFKLKFDSKFEFKNITVLVSNLA